MNEDDTTKTLLAFRVMAWTIAISIWIATLWLLISLGLYFLRAPH